MGEEEYYRLELLEETESYTMLVREGGRPSHPVDLGRSIIEQPGEYREILAYWQRGEKDWKVFSRQLSEWKDFRQWQRKNRENGRFHKYAEDVQQGLAEHGFKRPFQLEEHQDRQDMLATWIEFLDYEYWWYDKDMRTVEHQKPLYDAAWEELVDAQVLRPFETGQLVCDINSAIRRASERERAQDAVQSARLALLSAENKSANHRPSTFHQLSQQLLAEAQSRVDLALNSLELIKRRNALISEFLDKTKRARIAKRDAEHRAILVKWILNQIPLLEKESEAAFTESSATGLSTTVPSTTGLRKSKRKRTDLSDKMSFSGTTFPDSPENKSASKSIRRPIDRQKEAHSTQRSDDLDRDSLQSCKRSKRSTATMRSMHHRRSTEPGSLLFKGTSDNKQRGGRKERRSIRSDDDSGVRRSDRVKRAPDRFQ